MALVFEVQGFFYRRPTKHYCPRGLLFQVSRCWSRFLHNRADGASKTLQPSSPCR